MPHAVNGLKQCTKCKETKPVVEFNKDSSKLDKLQTHCKSCNVLILRKKQRFINRSERPFDYELIDENTARIPVKSKDIWVFAIVDIEHVEMLIQFKWSLDRNGYAGAGGGGSKEGRFSMHRMIMGLSKGDQSVVDHMNHDKLDNRKSVNLRLVDRSLNNRNRKTLGCIGVRFDERRGLWYARTYLQNKEKHIGSYLSKEDAMRAYDAFIKSLNLPPPYKLNFPNE
jgi:hypothetical protein